MFLSNAEYYGATRILPNVAPTAPLCVSPPSGQSTGRVFLFASESDELVSRSMYFCIIDKNPDFL